MEEAKKDIIKLKFAICLTRLIANNKEALLGDGKNIDNVTSLRQLEASSGVSFPIIQLASMGKRDVKLSTAIRIIESLGIQPSEFFSMYDELTDEDVKQGVKEIEKRRKMIKK